MTPIDIQVSRSKVMPFLYMLGKGGISVLQTSIFSLSITQSNKKQGRLIRSPCMTLSANLSVQTKPCQSECFHF